MRSRSFLQITILLRHPFLLRRLQVLARLLILRRRHHQVFLRGHLRSPSFPMILYSVPTKTSICVSTKTSPITGMGSVTMEGLVQFPTCVNTGAMLPIVEIETKFDASQISTPLKSASKHAKNAETQAWIANSRARQFQHLNQRLLLRHFLRHLHHLRLSCRLHRRPLHPRRLRGHPRHPCPLQNSVLDGTSSTRAMDLPLFQNTLLKTGFANMLHDIRLLDTLQTITSSNA